MFKKDLFKAYPDDPVTCSDDEWCYFIGHCDKIIEKMPDLTFTFPVKHDRASSATYRIPAKSFLFNDRDKRRHLDTCHVGVVRQQFSELDHFVLGSAFMENFYTVFDATDPNNNKVGLAANIEQVASDANGNTVAPTPTESSSSLSLYVGIGAIVAFAIFVVVITTCICIRKRKQQKLEKAKTYFDSLKTEDDGE